MTARPNVVIDPDTGIPDLIRRLTDDSKRLVTDEVQLAKLEAKDSLHRASRGALWLGLAFGVSIIMLVALTVFIATLIGRIANDHMWIGALVTGVIELALGFWLLKKGLSTYTKPSYTLEETRSSLADTKHWAATAKRA
ncbi:MAG TPA: phage holin family protein [Gemmatimonadaceae bacterium]|nr:phage holin family protein [Gemmatimonadaceae bacterium]